MRSSNHIRRLVIEISNGNKESEKKLFDALIDRFQYLAKRRIKGEDAKDIAMEACRTVVEKYDSIDFEGGRFEFWALKILRNKIGNYLQRKGTIDEHLGFRVSSDYIGTDGSADALLDLKISVRQCLRMIVNRFPKYARILNLVHLGYKTSEVCERMSIKPSYYYVLLSRCRLLMARCLEKGTIQ